MKHKASDKWREASQRSGWGTGIEEWADESTAYISVVFSWDITAATSLMAWCHQLGYSVVVGGPAIRSTKASLPDYVQEGQVWHDAVRLHNPNATFTSRGCIRKCPFCIVPDTEGPLVELKEWPIRPIICDNNLLACSMQHFDSVVDKLKNVRGIDFNQGLDCRRLNSHHINRLAELDTRCIRLAWDDTRHEKQLISAIQSLKAAGFQAARIWVYVLIGYNDTPEDALYRLTTIRDLGAVTFPMRYQPIGVTIKDSYVSPQWTDTELRRYMRYWSSAYYGSIPFDHFSSNKRVRPEDRPSPGQLELSL